MDVGSEMWLAWAAPDVLDTRQVAAALRAQGLSVGLPLAASRRIRVRTA